MDIKLVKKVFSARFVVAWPIWAGGYPDQQDALRTLNAAKEVLYSALSERVSSLLGNEFSLNKFVYHAGGHSPIDGLQSRDYASNSLELFIEVFAPIDELKKQKNISSTVAELVKELTGLCTRFFRKQMPGALEGANLYEVKSDWNPASGISYAETGNKRTRVFVSYSHHDSKWLTRLHTHLKPLSRQFSMDIWDDTQIKGGMNWREEIKKAIAETRVAILLISADFIASDFIATDELPPLLEAAEKEGATILPVILSPSMFHHVPHLSQFQAVNDPSAPLIALRKSEQEKIFHEVALRVMDSMRQ